MRVSICIPQYNRSGHLIKALRLIEQQSYADIEVVVSDDASTDDTVERVTELQKDYRFPLRFSVNEKNEGYDRNYRRCIELATGEYALVIGNDDSLFRPDAVEFLVHFLESSGFPDLGYCNYVEDYDHTFVYERAKSTKIQGSGIAVAMNHYNGFSFVGGLIYKKATFDQFNTSKHDKSVYAQMYLGLLMICRGCTLFTIREPLVLKDLKDDSGKTGYSFYKDGLPKKWKHFRKMDAGLPSVVHVLISAIEDATGRQEPLRAMQIVKRTYTVTYPYWIIQYKKHAGFVAALGLVLGSTPSSNKNMEKLRRMDKLKVYLLYYLYSLAGIVVPVAIYDRLEPILIRKVRSRNSG